MTSAEFYRIATHLSHGGFIKTWLHYNRPCDNPWVMALQCLDQFGKPERVLPLERRGFGWDATRGVHYIARTGEDGAPYVGACENKVKI